MNTIMNFLIDNWYLILIAIAVLVVVIYVVYNFIKKPNSEKFKILQNWLIIACEKAEEEFGKETGQLKLQYVYNLFITNFKWLSKILPYSVFENLLESALIKFKQMLINNKELQEKVYGKALNEAEIEKLSNQIKDAE